MTRIEGSALTSALQRPEQAAPPDARGTSSAALAAPDAAGREPAAHAAESEASSGFSAPYWRLFSAHAISNLGDGVCAVAYPWLASVVTRDPVKLSMLVVATRLPWFLFTLPAGVVIDRVDRRKLVITVNAAQLLLLLGIATVIFYGRGELRAAEAAAQLAVPPPHAALYLSMLYASALLFGAAEVLRDTATQTIVPALVRPDQLNRANGQLLSAEMVTNSFLGNPIGGALIAVSLSLPLFADAATFAVATVLIFAVRGSFAPRHRIEASQARWHQEIISGFRWLFAEPILRAMSLCLGLFNMALGVALGTFTLYCQEVLHLGPTGLGLLMTGGAVGSVISGWTASSMIRRLGSGAVVLLGVLGSGLAFGAMGLFSQPHFVWAMFVAYSFVVMPWSTLSRSLRQRLTPNHILGRTTSVHRLLAWGMIPVGNFVGGLFVSTAQHIVPRETALRVPLFVSAVAMITLAAFARRHLSTRRLEDAIQERNPSGGGTTAKRAAAPTV